MKLNTKLFFAFLLSCIAIVVLMSGIMHYYAIRNFSAYVHDVELKQLDDIIAKLEGEYKRYGNWEHIRTDPATWNELLHSVMQFKKNKMPPPPMPDDGSFRQPPAGLEPPPPPDMLPRIMLFDKDKHPVFGKKDSARNYFFKPIDVDGRTVGWLGLHRPEHISDPLQMKFLYRQSRAFIIIGIVILILAAMVSLFLSRHILLPVRKLAEGAHALTSRRFETRIDVNSSDELGQLSMDFNRMADTLERYEFMRKQWISDISHELRTPLAVMRAEIEAAQDGIRDLSGETLQSLHSEVMLLSRIVDDLHSLSRIDSDVLSMKMENLNPVEIAGNVITAFKSRFEQAGIRILPVPDDCRKISVTGDPERLAQVFSNILENTLKYTDSPGTLRTNIFARDNELHIVFDDSPPGVPSSSMPYLFERLYKTDISRSRQKGGSGLGLSISKSIIEAMKGRITADSSDLGGLKISIILPISINS
jgi:two-component system, OmpR family, sensor histidine kinase BaeS